MASDPSLAFNNSAVISFASNTSNISYLMIIAPYLRPLCIMQLSINIIFEVKFSNL